MSGKVYLLGAGPGDPELITVKAQRILGEADSVLYDRLVAPELLDLVPASAQCLPVGKAAGGVGVSQAQILRLLEARAGTDRVVVRLKGGDPFLFGRGAEEARYLGQRGIACEVVPGVSSALAGPAAFGIPVTLRQVASSVVILTGHQVYDPTSPIDWRALGGIDTLVILMGLRRLERIVAALLNHAQMVRSTPVAVLERATWPDQRMVSGSLGTICARVRSDQIQPPALIVVGEVVAQACLFGSSGIKKMTSPCGPSILARGLK